MKKRETPKSIERQLQICQLFGKTAELPEAQPYDYANQPDDPPSVEHWYKVRERHLFQQERMATYVSGCVCEEEDKHGWTTVKCCNRCGLSVEDFWNKHIH